jgi:hypothetical protein
MASLLARDRARPRWEEPLSTIQKDPLGGAVGLESHDLVDEGAEGSDAPVLGTQRLKIRAR